jgi:hypothetical protein
MFPGDEFTGMGQALPALRLAPEMGKDADRARVACGARGGADLAITKRIAVADDHQTTSHRQTLLLRITIGHSVRDCKSLATDDSMTFP